MTERKYHHVTWTEFITGTTLLLATICTGLTISNYYLHEKPRQEQQKRLFQLEKRIEGLRNWVGPLEIKSELG